MTLDAGFLMKMALYANVHTIGWHVDSVHLISILIYNAGSMAVSKRERRSPVNSILKSRDKMQTDVFSHHLVTARTMKQTSELTFSFNFHSISSPSLT